MTKDHVFPKSWYPRNTPKQIERWTVPSCYSCNQKFKEIEEDLKLRIGLTLAPDDFNALGIADDVRRSYDPSCARNKKDADNRKMKKEKILKNFIREASLENKRFMPNFGPQRSGKIKVYSMVEISPESVRRIGGKIILGAYYKILGKLVESDMSLDIYTDDAGADDFESLMSKYGKKNYFGPGINLVTAIPADEKSAFVAKVTIWGRFIFRGFVLTQ